MRLCQRCGYMQPGEAEPTKPSVEQVAILEQAILSLEQHLERYMHAATLQRKFLDEAVERMDEKLNAVLEVVLAQTEAKRQSVVAKVKRRLGQKLILESIRLANRDGSEG